MSIEKMPAGEPKRRTSLVWHERFAWYEAGIGAGFAPAGGLVQPFEAVDAPVSKARLRSLIDVAGLVPHLRLVDAVEADESELREFHDVDYLGRLSELQQRGCGDAGIMAPVGPDGYLTARLGAGGCGVAVDEVMTGRADNAYALVRPPGHHARRDQGIGSCLLANGVLAAMRARRLYGAERIAILDWDVHHGNGAEEAFWDDPNILTISLHQDGYFPAGTGALDDVGGDGAAGSNINVPLPAGSGQGAYLAAMTEIVEPAVIRHRPDLLIVACGYDAGIMDPMGRMLLHSESFRLLAGRVRTLAEDLCGGRFVMLQEGGYSAAYTPFCGLAVLEEMVGTRVADDPFLDVFIRLPGQDITQDQRKLINDVRSLRRS